MSAVSEPQRPLLASFVAGMLLWISRTLASLLVACPVVFAIAASGVASGPQRDAVLFQPGSLFLLELARIGAPLLVAAFKETLALSALAGVLGLVPLGAVLELLASGQVNDFAARLARGVRLLPGFLALGAIALLTQAALLLASSLLGSALTSGAHGRDERWLTLTPVAVLGLGLVCCAWVGAVLDLARCALLQREFKARDALHAALSVLRKQPLGVLLGSYPSSAGSVFACVVAAWGMTKIDLAGGSTRNIVLAFAAHQAAIALGLALRVRWLRRALEQSA